METGRVLYGLSAAVLVPWGVGWHRSRPWLMVLFAVIYGGYAIAPYRTEERPWLALVAAALVAMATVFLHSPAGLPPMGFSVTLPLASGPVSMTRRVGIGMLVAATALSLWAAGGTAQVLGEELLLSDRATIFASSGLVAVFGGGALAQAATTPVRRAIAGLPAGDAQRRLAEDFMMGSRSIGLLERGLMFAFLAAGQPEAAALALTAKSLARGPASDHGKYASEYFLLGTLASVIAALAMSMAARATVGLPVL
ncbi:hypothetical protein [Streptomyces melanogenes]|uniref:Integral membrane protein n=1 Tax=Streptomyces melanogenes TaxID=67326 RepID=A0ABZ1XKH1_9ACTN|nr:hypothetical protein [Streptomyces melanogenes]